MLKILSTTAFIVFLAISLDIALLYRQATVGKLLWKIKLLPDIGGYI